MDKELVKITPSEKTELYLNKKLSEVEKIFITEIQSRGYNMATLRRMKSDVFKEYFDREVGKRQSSDRDVIPMVFPYL